MADVVHDELRSRNVQLYFDSVGRAVLMMSWWPFDNHVTADDASEDVFQFFQLVSD